MDTRIVSRSISVVTLLACATSIAQTPPPQVSLVTLPLPAGGSDVVLTDLDAAGNVLGSVKIGTRYEVVEWIGGKTPVVLPRLPADQSKSTLDYIAVALNSAGGVLASAQQGSATTFPGVYWDPSHHPTAVPGSARVSGLSATGSISGSIGILDGDSETAARWTTPGAQPVTLPYGSIDNCGGPCGYFGGPISPNGKYIVAFVTPPFGHGKDAAIYANGVIDSRFNDVAATVSQITDAEVVIGAKDTGIASDISVGDVYQAMRWESGVYTNLGALPGAPAGFLFESRARSMSANGAIVGYSQYKSGFSDSHAVMWIHDEIIDLHPLLASQLPTNWVASDSYALNDSGEFIVVAADPNSDAKKYYLAKPLIPTHTTITSNINPSTYGQQIHLVAKVSPDSGPVPTTGSVSWYDTGMLLGTARMTAIGTSSWEPSTWTGGVHNVTAVFPANATLASSTSPVFKQTVNAATTRTTVSVAANPAIHGQPVKLTATVVPVSGTIAGTVTFKSGSTVLGTGTLDARTKQTWLTTSFAKAGSYPITASFAGSQNFVPSASATVNLTVK
jgi:hypothetical protein